MVLIVVGALILAAAVHFRRVSRIAPDARPVAGRVVEVERRRSSISGSRTMLYGPSVRYADPVTGEERVLPPASYQPRVYEVGEAVSLMWDPASGELRLPLPRPRAQMAMPFAFGVGIIALGVADLAG